MVIVAWVWDRSLWVWIGVVFMGSCRWVGFHHAMGFGCSYSGVSPGRRVFKIPFDKRQDTG